MRIRVLNLDRSHGRLASFRARNPHLPDIERVAAIDGGMLDRARMIAEGQLAGELPYTPGAIGNAVSHMGQWAEAVALGMTLTVLEDDAVLCGNFVAEASRILASLGPDWDYVQWGYNFDTFLTYDLMPGISACSAVFDQQQMRRSLPVFHRCAVASQPYRLIRALGLPGYSISPRGAAKLLAFCRPLRPLQIHFPLLGMRPNFGIEYMLNAVYQDIAAYVVVPAMCLTANDTAQSTVQDLEDRTGPANFVRNIGAA